MPHVLLLATTTGYQTRAFDVAADRLGVDLVFATDRCDVLDDPWRDRALPIRFFDEAGSVATILEAHRSRRIDGVLAVGDRPTVIAAQVCRELGLPGHPPDGASAARNKLRTRDCLRAAGLPTPWYRAFSLDDPSASGPGPPWFPAVVKPVALSGSRGVMRVDDEEGLAAAVQRLRSLIHTTELRAERDEAHSMAIVEGFIPGREFAVEGLMSHGTVQVLAIFDKPDPLDGPFFEETIYVTPSTAPSLVQDAIADAVTQAASALGLRHGPFHAECRVGGAAGSSTWAESGPRPAVYVLEVAARPIGGLCARALRFHDRDSGDLISLEELLLRHALGESPRRWARERAAAGVMMIPIPRRGVFRGLIGLEDAHRVPGVDEVRVTAKPDQVLVPLPESASYLGFIFAHGQRPIDVERALRAAHARLEFRIEPEVRVVQSAHA